MKIRLLRRYSAYSSGRVIDCVEEVARRLIEEGVAKPDVIETAAVEMVAERADATPAKVKRAIPKPENQDSAGR